DCVGCGIQPDKTLAFDSTWMAATFQPQVFTSMSVDLKFTGVAIYVFFILANNQGPGITTRTVCRFLLDGAIDSTFIHEPTNSTDFQYDALAYGKTGLSNTAHTVTILTNTSDPNIPPGGHVFVSFDYAIYTFDDGVGTAAATSSTSTSAGPTLIPSGTSKVSKGPPVVAIVGPIVGVLALAGIAGIAFYCLRKRKRETESDEHPQISPFIDHDPRQLHSGTDGKMGLANTSGSLSPSGRNEMMSVSSRPSYEPSSPPSQSHFGFGNAGASGLSVPPLTGRTHTSMSSRMSATGVPGASPMATPTLEQPVTSFTDPEGSSTPPSRSIDRSRASAEHSVVMNRSPDDGASIREIRQQELGRKVAEMQRKLTGRVAVVQQSNSASEVAELRSEVNQLREQLVHLRNQQQSPWALGLSDDPPPGYYTSG
ncbi:hypothetical protein BDN72DRAFT_850041, partial [Pluteus cervinus]